MDFRVWKNNQQLGPFTEEEIRRKIGAGELFRDDLGWAAGQGDWKPLSEILGEGSTPPPPPDSGGSATSGNTILQKATGSGQASVSVGGKKYSLTKRVLLALLIAILALSGITLGNRAFRKHGGESAAATPPVIDFASYNKPDWLRGFYKKDVGSLNANREEILFYCNFFDMEIGDLLPLLHDVEIRREIASQLVTQRMSDSGSGLRALIDVVRQAQQPGGPQRMMDNAESQETLKQQAIQDAERLVETSDKDTIRRVYDGLGIFVRYRSDAP